MTLSQGGLPVAISMTVHPTLQISQNLVREDCLRTSGAIHWTVPFKERPLKSVSTSLEILFAVPKSASLQTPLLSTKTLAPLMSLWIAFLTWRYSKPCRICRV